MISTRVRFLLRTLISLALLALLATKVDWKALGATLRGVDFPLVLLASLLTPLLIMLMAMRWSLFLRQQGISVALGRIFRLVWAGQFFNSVLPGSTGGDLIKIHRLCQWLPERKAAAAASVVADRFCALLALGVLALAAFAAGGFPAPVWEYLSWKTPWLWGLGTAGFVGLATLVLVWKRGNPLWKARVRHFFWELRTCFGWNRAVAGAVALSFAVHLVNFTIVFGFARALGIQIGFLQVLTMLPVIMILLLLPITVNGHGLREVLLVFYLSYWKISSAGTPGLDATGMALSLSILAVANDMLWSLPGGIWYFLKRS